MKKSTAATNAIARCVPSPRSGFVEGKTPVESVHTKSANTTSQLQWMPTRIPAILPSSRLDPNASSLAGAATVSCRPIRRCFAERIAGRPGER